MNDALVEAEGEFIARLGSGEAFEWREASYGKLHIQRKWADVG